MNRVVVHVLNILIKKPLWLYMLTMVSPHALLSVTVSAFYIWKE